LELRCKPGVAPDPNPCLASDCGVRLVEKTKVRSQKIASWTFYHEFIQFCQY
jgi:hypothetical protein